MMHLLMVIDGPRLDDDRRPLQHIARGLRDASVEQTHILAAPEDQQAIEPLLEDVVPIETEMPVRWWRRGAQAATLARQLEPQSIDAIFWSGDAATVLAHDLAAHLEVPLIGDVWRLDQVERARRNPWVDTWIARSERVGSLLRDAVSHGTLVTARPPVDTTAMARLPDTRPTLVVLDPGSRTRDAEYLVEAIAQLLLERPDLETFFELQGGSSQRLWRMLQQADLLERVTVLDQMGSLTPLVAESSILVAPDPSGPARSLIPLSMCGGTAVVAASSACEDLLVHNETALILNPGDSAAWAAALGSLLSDPPLRQRLAQTGRTHALKACRAETAIAAWITAITSSAEPAPYPIVNTQTTR